MVWTKVTVSSYMYYYTVNLSPSIIIRDAVIVKWAVMQQTKRVTFTHTCPLIFFFLSFSKIFILVHYRDHTFGHSSSLQVIVDHYRSLQVIVGHCRSLQVIVGHCRSLQVIVAHCRSFLVLVTMQKAYLQTVLGMLNSTKPLTSYSISPFLIL